MAKKKARNTKSRIVIAAWKLFYEQGYDDTTVEEIIEASGTSRGSFYHYFEGKDALLSSLSYLFDEKYVSLMEAIDPGMNAFDKLMYLNAELFGMIENSVSLDLLARLYSSQLVTRGDKHLLDHNRVYYKLLRQIASDGIGKGELSAAYTVNELVNIYAMLERALLYDWCISGGGYSLKNYAARMFPLLYGFVRGQ
ncbi:MAG TPA: TetR/AcrR family transcriptional regulator [Clostridia bacterium]|nr:TetR/AcrR family transcriptional regulator [Clostridia bacterium]